MESEIEIACVSPWRRLANLVIDHVSIYLIVIVLLLIASIIFGDQVIEKFESISPMIINCSAILVYYIAFESLTAQTIGKMVTRTKVVSANGGKPSLKQVLVRTLIRFVPFEWITCIDDKSRGWHDSIPKTYVVRIASKGNS